MPRRELRKARKYDLHAPGEDMDASFTHAGRQVEVVDWDAGDGPTLRVEVDGRHAGDVWMRDDERWTAESPDSRYDSVHDTAHDAVVALVVNLTDGG